MGTHTDQRERTMMVAHILYEETDESHPMPLSVLIRRLKEQGVTAERKSLYRDLAALQRHGAEIRFRAGGEGGWFLSSRIFTIQELRALADAAEVYPCLTEELRQSLRDKLPLLAPRHQREGLRRPVACQRTGLARPAALRSALDRIQAACRSGKVLSFVYLSSDGSRAPEEARRMVSPKGLLWARETYHLLAWDHREKALRLYRPERMGDLLVMGLPAKGPKTDPALWVSAPFGLDPARRERVRLRCHPSLGEEVLDRFGAASAILPGEEGLTVAAEVVMGPAFWGWMAAHSDRAELLSPPWAARLWRRKYRSAGGEEAAPTKVV